MSVGYQQSRSQNLEIAGFLIHFTFFSLGQSVEKVDPATGVKLSDLKVFTGANLVLRPA